MKYWQIKKIAFFFVFAAGALPVFTQSPGGISQVWVADQGDGTYKNPILYADYSDPDAIRVGEDYYLTASSFNCMPGLPILHSRDLVNWEIIGHALQKQIPEAFFEVPQHGNGVWAPCLRYHDGEFYIYWGDPDHGVYMVKTRDPAGDWELPVLVKEGKGIIDTSPLWDDDGQVYLVHGWAGSRAGVNSLITVNRMNADGTRVLDEGKHVFDGHDGHKTIEGPKFYKRNGYYYIFAPAGGVPTGWQLILRSRDIYGPYEEKIVLEQGSTPVNGPHQGGWVETPGGESWFLHFQDVEAYGRILHLQPVHWVGDWPMMGNDKDGNGVGEPVLRHKKPDVGATYPIQTPAESDEFNTDELGLQWQWHANPRVVWSALLRGKDYLRLFAVNQPAGAANLWPVPNLLLQKFPAPDFTATTKVTWQVEFEAWQEKKAGLIITGNDYAYLAISQDDKGYKISQARCKNAEKGTAEEVVAEKRIGTDTAYLRVNVSGPDAKCRFSYSEDGQRFTPIGEEFTALPDKWIGAKVGLFATSASNARRGSYADFDWFRVTK
ncbi:MAG TPA: glycoside hydrolase 43 family protein [Flavilitoribacter sp.]|nr:glycoside hydrolase 43 family protein [Flavilitoribacter sp.]HMQ87583.1 glycoside hydrolase 43 family protein [Flavilitoribacter sp.]